jgi:hypothetical protein
MIRRPAARGHFSLDTPTARAARACAAAGFASVVAAIVLSLAAAPAGAWPKDNARDGWQIGVAYGLGIAKLTVGEQRLSTDWEWGTTPQLHVGRMISKKLMLGFENQMWFDEQGVNVNESGVSDRARVTVQSWTLGLTWFPGRPDSPWGGAYLQAGGGLSNSRLILLEPVPYDPNRPASAENFEEVFKEDQSGTAAFVGAGYEFRVSRAFALGGRASYNHLFTDKSIFKESDFWPFTLHMNWYF